MLLSYYPVLGEANIFTEELNMAFCHRVLYRGIGATLFAISFLINSKTETND